MENPTREDKINHILDLCTTTGFGETSPSIYFDSLKNKYSNIKKFVTKNYHYIAIGGFVSYLLIKFL